MCLFSNPWTFPNVALLGLLVLPGLCRAVRLVQFRGQYSTIRVSVFIAREGKVCLNVSTITGID